MRLQKRLNPARIAYFQQRGCIDEKSIWQYIEALLPDYPQSRPLGAPIGNKNNPTGRKKKADIAS